VVHDVKVLSTEQVGTRISPAVLRRSLKTLAGASHGRSAKAWRAWWEANEKRLLPKP